jgi:UDP-N-acetylglucosamine 3-dehydrogenase
VNKLSPLRIGLIGCGAFGESHLAAFAGIPYVDVVTVTDRSLDRAQDVAKRYGISHVARSFREMPEIDAVSVVTTEDQHLEPVLSALNDGKHVFVEKPMATNVEDAQKMVDAAKKSGLFLMPGHLLRFDARYAIVKQKLETGSLGKVLSIYARRNRPKWQGAIYKRTPLVLETAIHDIDTILWYMKSKVKSVQAWETLHNGDAEPGCLSGVLHFETGSVALFQTSWALPDKTPFLDDCMQVITSSGVANIDVLHSGLSIWSASGVEVPDVSYEPRISGVARGALRDELEYFAVCCMQKRAPTLVTADDAVEAIKVSTAIVQAANEKREIHL